MFVQIQIKFIKNEISSEFLVIMSCRPESSIARMKPIYLRYNFLQKILFFNFLSNLATD